MRFPSTAARALAVTPLLLTSATLGTYTAQAAPSPQVAAAADLSADVSFVATDGELWRFTSAGGASDEGIANVGGVAWSGDGSRFALSYGQGGVISVLDSTGDALTVDAAEALGAVAWHPAGYEVAAVVDENGQPRVARAKADGTGRLLAAAPGQGGPTSPTSLSYLLDGSGIYLTDSGAAGKQVELLDLDTGTSARVVPDAAGAAAAQQKDAVVSPDGERVAYVQGSGAGESIWLMDVDGAGAVQVLASGDVADGGLAWTVDGLALYYLTAAGPASLRVVDATAGATATTLAANLPAGTSLATRPVPIPVVRDRMSGADRVATAINISTRSFSAAPAGTPSCEAGNAEAVVLARSDLFPDGLVAGPLAADRCAPLLLTPPTVLDARVLTEIRRILKPGATVYIIGSTGAISAATQTQLVAAGFAVTRYAGATRYETAVDVATRGLGAPGVVLLATGLNFPDALAAGPAAYTSGGAVLLTAGTLAQAATSAYISSHQPDVWAIGGPAAQAYPTAEDVSGPDRYATSVAVAQTFFYPPKTVFLASGLNFPDAMSGGARAAKQQEPLLLTHPTTLPTSVGTLVSQASASASAVTAFGGPSVVSDAVVAQVAGLAQGAEPWFG
jgi:putative cell wall-binding protein